MEPVNRDREEHQVYAGMRGFSASAGQSNILQQMQMLDAVLNAGTEEIYVLDREGRFLFVNQAGAKAIGRDRDEIAGKSGREIGAPEEIVSQFDRERDIVFSTAAPLSGSVTYPTPSGPRNYSYDWTPLLAQDGAVISALFAARDVTERDRAEEALRRMEAALAREEKLLGTTLRSIGDAVMATDVEGRVSFMNPLAEHLTGWTEPEARGRACQEVFHIVNETTRQEVPNPVQRVLEEGAVVGLANHTLLIAKDGSERPVADSGAPIRDEEGHLFGVVLVFRDVSEQSKAQLAQERLAAIVASSDDAIVSKGLNGIVTSWNPAAERLYGYPAEEVIGQSKSLVIPPDLPNELRTILEQIQSGNSIAHYETRRVRKDGSLFDVSISVSPLRDAEGHIIGASTIARDITAHKREERAREFLAQSSETLASSLDYEQTLQTVTKLAVPHMADWCAVDMLEEDGSIRLLGLAHVDPEKVRWGHELRRLYPPALGEPGLPTVLQTGQSEIYSDIPDELLVAGARDAQHLEVMRQIGFRSVMIVPILAWERVLGAITFVTTHQSGHSYSKEDLRLAEGLAARAALAIENARLYRAAQEELAERTRVQDALRLSEERFRFALANSSIIVYTQDRDLRYTWVYDGALNAEETRIYGKTDAEILESDDAIPLTEIKRRVLQTGIDERHVVRATQFGREPLYMDTSFAPLRDSDGNIVGITGTSNNITERKKAQDALIQHQAEIEALNARLQRSMSETHHRVKNNLQVISALLDMQEMQYEDSVSVFEISRLRQHIQALSTIHDLLTYQAKKDAEVYDLSIKEAMEKLIPIIQSVVAGRPIGLTIEDLRMPVRQGTTFTVLVNELVSNAVKHGKGNIQVTFYTRKGNALLEVTDEGPGFPETFDAATSANTGLELVQTLAQLDLHGETRFENRPEGGARVVIEFPIPSTIRTRGEQ